MCMPMSMCSTQDSNGHVKLAAVLSVVPFLSPVGKMLDSLRILMFAKDCVIKRVRGVEMIRAGLREPLCL